MPTDDRSYTTHQLTPEVKAQLLAIARALPPLTAEQQDALAETLAMTHIEAGRRR